MNDLGSLLVWVALMVIVSLMDAAARRRRARERSAPEESGETAPWELPEPVTEETESEWRELRPRPVEVDEVEVKVGAPPPVLRVPLPPEPEPTPEPEAPALLEAAEAIRERSRREIAASVAPPVPSAGAAPSAPQGRRGRALARRDRVVPSAHDLRALLRSDPGALRTAVLYREVLGSPLGARLRPGGWEGPGAPDDA